MSILDSERIQKAFYIIRIPPCGLLDYNGPFIVKKLDTIATDMLYSRLEKPRWGIRRVR